MTDTPGVKAAAGAIERYCTDHGIAVTPSMALMMAEIAAPHFAAAVESNPDQLGVFLACCTTSLEETMPEPSQDAADTRDLLTRAEDALHSIAMRLLAVSPQLKTPYPDMPEQSAWSMSLGPQARRAHDLAFAIRKHLGLPHHHASRALGTPPLEAEDVIAEAAAAERERIRQLAIKYDAIYDSPCPSGLANCVHQDRRFADLLSTTGGDPS